MAAVSMSANVTRIAQATIASDTGTWGNDGGGGGVADEPDIVYQGTTAQSRKVSTSPLGRNYTHGSGTDMTAAATAHFIAKINATNNTALNTRATPAMWVKVGSGSGAYYDYYVFGSDNYPAKGGWQILAINPNVSGYRDGTTGSPTLSSVLYWSLMGDFTATAKAENLVIDAIDLGRGLCLVGGDGASADGTWDDFVTYDEGTTGNRWGFCTSDSPAIFFIGRIAIGQTSGGTSTLTEFVDSGKTLIWRNGYVATGFHELLLDVATNSTIIDISGNAFDSQGEANNTAGRGYTTTEDSRLLLTTTTAGTSVTLDAIATSWNNCAGFDINCSEADFTNAKITNSGQIDCNTYTPTFVGASVSGYTGAADSSALYWNASTDPNGYLDNMSFTMGATSTHAIEFGTASPTTINLTGIDFSGYTNSVGSSAAPLYIARTTGTVTINASGCTGLTADGYKSAGATVNIVIDPVTVSVTTRDNAGAILGSCEVFVVATGTSTLPAINTTTKRPARECTNFSYSGGTVTVTFAAAHNLATGDYVWFESDGGYAAFRGVHQVTYVDATNVSYTTAASDPGTADAGDAAFVFIKGTSNASTGYISMSRTFSAAQQAEGWARKSSGSPYYKEGAVSGDVSATTGLDMTARLSPDQ